MARSSERLFSPTIFEFPKFYSFISQPSRSKSFSLNQSHPTAWCPNRQHPESLILRPQRLRHSGSRVATGQAVTRLEPGCDGLLDFLSRGPAGKFRKGLAATAPAPQHQAYSRILSISSSFKPGILFRTSLGVVIRPASGLGGS
jgi:hypothetical protein